MNKPFLSVVMPTMRSGGLDVVFAGLSGQTFRDFELVISDGLFQRRKDLVRERAKDYFFSVVHVEPLGGSTFPNNDFCRTANSGLIHTRGEIVLFITDYTWLPPDCLTLHAAFHRGSEPGRGLMGPHRYVALPEPHPDFPRYQECQSEKDTEHYAVDVLSGKHDPFMWSLWSEFFSGDARELPTETGMPNRDPKLDRFAGPIEPTSFHGKNESCRLERVIEINGWDEALDGTHGWQDSDLAERLGLSWTIDPSNVAVIVNPRLHFPFARRNKDIWENERTWRKSQAAGYPRPNTWSLKAEREKCGF